MQGMGHDILPKVYVPGWFWFKLSGSTQPFQLLDEGTRLCNEGRACICAFTWYLVN